MKNFLLVLFGFLYFQASSQIQLDSIIYYDISSSAKVNSIKYEYNSEQQLITYYEDGVKIELEYNDNNDINKLLITEDYYMDFLQTWNLKYDDQNLLDSIIIDFPEYYGMDNFDIYDYLKQLKHLQIF